VGIFYFCFEKSVMMQYKDENCLCIFKSVLGLNCLLMLFLKKKKKKFLFWMLGSLLKERKVKLTGCVWAQ
jgi:hypothetical protein